MGKAYSDAQKVRVRALLEAGRDEDSIERETGVSDRTIRRWKLDLERTGRIGKPPESRTGRHRVLSPEIQVALFEHAKLNPGLSVDDMLWWLHDQYKIVVGTRTIRRAFEQRKGDRSNNEDANVIHNPHDAVNNDVLVHDIDAVSSPSQHHDSYPVHDAPMVAQDAEHQLAQVLQQQQQQQQQSQHEQSMAETQQSYAAAAFAASIMPTEMNNDLPDDEETIQLQLEQIALRKHELELKLKMRRLQQRESSQLRAVSASSLNALAGGQSPLYNPIVAAAPTPPKRDSRSKRKIAETIKRTAERQERMLRELERRSRRRDHFTAEWVASKDIWPLRAQALLAGLMHQYSCYAYSQATADVFEIIYQQLYSLVDLSKGDWNPAVHDDLLRERTKRKVSQLRIKMQKTGEIVGRGDLAYGVWAKADDFTGEQAGESLGGDDSELPDGMTSHNDHDHGHASTMTDEQQLAYDSVAEHAAMGHASMPYGAAMLSHQHSQSHSPQQQQHSQPPQYPLMPQQHHTGMLPYGQMDGSQAGLSHQENIVM